jgi:hypothetical protein
MRFTTIRQKPRVRQIAGALTTPARMSENNDSDDSAFSSLSVAKSAARLRFFDSNRFLCASFSIASTCTARNIVAQRLGRRNLGAGLLHKDAADVWVHDKHAHG